MSGRMPVVFVSRGAPDALVKASDAVDCWRTLGRQIPGPAAILIVSSHWEAPQPTASRPHFSYGGLAMDAYVWGDGAGV